VRLQVDARYADQLIIVVTIRMPIFGY
jgi:hypothetical protein